MLKTNSSGPRAPVPERKSQEPEFDLTSITESSTDSFLLFDEQLNCVGINPAAQRLFDVVEADIVGRSIREIIPAISKDLAEHQRYLNVVRTGEPLITNTRFGGLDLGIKAFKVGDGIGITASDITERKQAEEELREHCAQMETQLAERTVAVQNNDEERSREEDKRKQAEEELRERCVQLETQLAERTVVAQNSDEERTQEADERIRMAWELQVRDIAIASSLSPIALTDIQGNITYANQSFIRMWGFRRKSDIDAVNKRSITELFWNEDEAREVLRVLREDGEWKDALTGRKLDGSALELQASFNVITNDTGVPDCIAASFVDLTDRKRIEEKLRVKDMAMALSFHPIAMTGIDTKITYVNDAFLKMWGYDSDEEILGGPAERFWHGEEDATDMWESLCEGGYSVGELVAVRKDGTTFDVELSATMITDEHDRAISIMGSFIDITGRDSMADVSSDRHYQQSDLLHYLDDAVLLVGKGYEIEDLNDNALELLEKSREQVIGQSYYQMVNAGDGPADDCPLKLAIDTGEAQSTFRELFGKPISLRISPVLDEGGEVIRLIAVIRDVTEVKIMEDKLQGFEQKFTYLSERFEQWVDKLNSLMEANRT